MTSQSDFSAGDWQLILEGPPSAGLIVITAQRGGTIRETFSIAKTYAQARQHHGQSELLDEIVAAKPEIDHSRSGSPAELKERCLSHLRDAVGVLDGKATPEEIDDYRRFVMTLSEKVASAHREEGSTDDPISDPERAAIADIARALGVPSG